MTRNSYRAWCGVIGRVLPKPAALMREALSETLPVRIATGEIRAYLPVSSDEGMAAGSGTSLQSTVTAKFMHSHLTVLSSDNPIDNISCTCVWARNRQYILVCLYIYTTLFNYICTRQFAKCDYETFHAMYPMKYVHEL